MLNCVTLKDLKKQVPYKGKKKSCMEGLFSEISDFLNFVLCRQFLVSETQQPLC